MDLRDGPFFSLRHKCQLSMCRRVNAQVLSLPHGSALLLFVNLGGPGISFECCRKSPLAETGWLRWLVLDCCTARRLPLVDA